MGYIPPALLFVAAISLYKRIHVLLRSYVFKNSFQRGSTGLSYGAYDGKSQACAAASAYAARYTKNPSSHVTSPHKRWNMAALQKFQIDVPYFNTNEKILKIVIVPWLIAGVDSAPCTVLAEVETRG
jgi:hypothetical protein